MCLDNGEDGARSDIDVSAGSSMKPFSQPTVVQPVNSGTIRQDRHSSGNTFLGSRFTNGSFKFCGFAAFTTKFRQCVYSSVSSPMILECECLDIALHSLGRMKEYIF